MRERARRILTWYVVSTATKPSGVSGTPALDLSHAVAGRPPEARKTTSATTLAGGAGAGAAPAAAAVAAESASSMGAASAATRGVEGAPAPALALASARAKTPGATTVTPLRAASSARPLTRALQTTSRPARLASASVSERIMGWHGSFASSVAPLDTIVTLSVGCAALSSPASSTPQAPPPTTTAERATRTAARVAASCALNCDSDAGAAHGSPFDRPVARMR